MRMNRKYVVLNYDHTDHIVVRVIEAENRGKAIEARAQEISDPSHIFAISNAIPSTWGNGGTYLSPVSVKMPPPTPPIDIKIKGLYMKKGDLPQ